MPTSETARWTLCTDGKWRSKEGSIRCPHGRERHQCRECKGSGVCAHSKIRNICKECKGASICPHDLRRRLCLLCKPETAVEEYKKNATRRGYVWEISSIEACHVASQPCYYCGKIPSAGIDRKVNNIGYTLPNCLPCCGPCNMLKKDRSVEEFIKICLSVASYRGRHNAK